MVVLVLGFLADKHSQTRVKEQKSTQTDILYSVELD